MRLLLDECVPKRLGQLLVPHEVQTVQKAGWSGLKNGALLAKAAELFDVFLTVDQGIRHQQNLSGVEICVVSLSGASNDIRDLEPLVPKLLDALTRSKPGMFIHIVP